MVQQQVQMVMIVQYQKVVKYYLMPKEEVEVVIVAVLEIKEVQQVVQVMVILHHKHHLILM